MVVQCKRKNDRVCTVLYKTELLLRRGKEANKNYLINQSVNQLIRQLENKGSYHILLSWSDMPPRLCEENNIMYCEAHLDSTEQGAEAQLKSK